VPAAKARLTVFSRFFCSLQAQDDIQAGISSFYSEIRRVKEVLTAINHGSVVFAVFDELFKGTNVKDALDCSSAVVNGISGLPGCIFLISSHLLELHDLVEAPERFYFRYFDAEIDNGRAQFDYCLRAGVNRKRLGYFILQQEGIMSLLKHSSN
jgi:DNA mismatch repair ATPase MutS